MSAETCSPLRCLTQRNSGGGVSTLLGLVAYKPSACGNSEEKLKNKNRNNTFGEFKKLVVNSFVKYLNNKSLCQRFNLDILCQSTENHFFQ